MTDHLDVLLADGVIDEVLGRLKSGKEANISLVRRGDHVLAAKVYKDRATRSFKNNADYKEGRKVRNSRTQRAIEGGGRFGREAAEQAWKSAEADALYKLVGSGVRVPEPVMFYEGVLLMELVRDGEGRPAPRLIDVTIDAAAAVGVYADLVAQLIAMLCCDLIHGDLSPYNILAGADGPTIIDFPQVVSAVHSSRAEFFFLRDFDNIVRFVSGFDPSLAIHRHDGRAIWRAYVGRELTREFVPPPPPPPQPRGGGPNRWRDQPRRDERRGDGGPSRPPDPRRQGGPPRDGASAARTSPRPPQGGGPGGDRRWERAPQPEPRRPNGGASGPPQDPARRGPEQAPRGRDNPPRTSPDAQGARPPRPAFDPQRPQRPAFDPQRPQRPAFDPQRSQRPAFDAQRPPSSSGPPRAPDRAPGRSTAPPPQYARAQPRDGAGPSAPGGRGRRRRPKRHW